MNKYNWKFNGFWERLRREFALFKSAAVQYMSNMIGSRHDSNRLRSVVSVTFARYRYRRNQKICNENETAFVSDMLEVLRACYRFDVTGSIHGWSRSHLTFMPRGCWLERRELTLQCPSVTVQFSVQYNLKIDVQATDLHDFILFKWLFITHKSLASCCWNKSRVITYCTDVESLLLWTA